MRINGFVYLYLEDTFFDRLNLFFLSDWNEIEKIYNFTLFSFGKIFRIISRYTVFDEFCLTKVFVEILILN